MSNAVAAMGTTLKKGTTEVAEIKSFKLPSMSRDGIEVTHMQSPNFWREFIKGVKDAGEFSCTVNLLPADGTHDAKTGLLSDFADDRTISSWTITLPTLPTATEWVVDAFITKFDPSADFEKALEADVTFKVTGKPDLDWV